MVWTRPLRLVTIDDVASVGGKNASLGEMLQALVPLGVRIPEGFAVTADAYRAFLQSAGLEAVIARELGALDPKNVDDLVRRSDRIRAAMTRTSLPSDVAQEVTRAYRELSGSYGEEETDVAVRSSATAEDLPNASFAGQQESYLNVRGSAFVLDAVRNAFASLFTPRAIRYRVDMGFGHDRIALSVGVQKMVRSDRASAEIFDGFSIGSNDLTQLTLGVDRDSTTVAPLFDERNEAVKWSCARLLEAAHLARRKVGICGQAPSDFPDFAAFLVARGIDSISLNPDALVRTTRRVVEMELELARARSTAPAAAPTSAEVVAQ